MKVKYVILFLVILLVSSCSIYQRGENVDRRQKKLKRMSSEKLYNEVVAHYLDYKNVNFKKMTITYEEDKKKQQFRGSVRVLKDSVIWLSISKMGIEGVRVLLTPSRVSFIDRMHREYMVTDYSYLSDKFHLDLDFFLIQSIIMNQLPEYRLVDNEPFHKNFKSRRGSMRELDFSKLTKGAKVKKRTKEKTDYLFINKNRKDRKYWKSYRKETGNRGFTSEILSITPDLMRLENVSIFEPQFFIDGTYQIVNFNLHYEDYKKYEGKYLFPKTVIAKLIHKHYEKTAKEDNNIIIDIRPPVKLTIEIDKLKVNEEGLRFPFNISSKYKRIDE